MQNAQLATVQEDEDSTGSRFEMSAKEFSDFKLFLNVIKPEFRDFSVVDGAFRSYCNDRSRNCIVETGFPFFSDITFNVCNIKSFIKAISTHGKKSPVTVTVTDRKIKFEDSIGGDISFLTPNPEMVDTPFVTYEDLWVKFLRYVDPDKLMVNDAMPELVVSRMKKASRKLSAKFMRVKNELNKNHLIISDKFNGTSRKSKGISGESKGSVEHSRELKRPFLIPLQENHYFDLDILPTLFNHDDMYLKCYLTDDEKIFAILNTKVNDLFVNIFLESKLCKETKVPLKGSVEKPEDKSKKNEKKILKPLAMEHRNGL
jgi:hypothetical protein